MDIRVQRIRQGKESTLSELYIGEEKICYVLEDVVRPLNEAKVPGKTAIPAGRYKLAFNVYGAMNNRYASWYPKFHKGMLELQQVPNFSYIYIHQGNTVEDTAGCLLVGKQLRLVVDDYRIEQSRQAYVLLYKRIIALMEKEEVYIVISNL